jgi:hypothetical protein
LKNNGQITVFLSLVLISLLGLFLAAVGITGIYMNRARVAEAARGASLHIQAEYQSQIFDRYHLLLLDKSYMGYGEGMLEERVSDYMDYTLSGYGFAVEDACLTDVRTVVADDCYDLKKQIEEYMTLYLETKALETISEDLAYDNADAEEVAEEIRNGKSEETEQEGNWQGEDPRKLLEQELGIGLLQLVLPSGKSVSQTKVSMQDVPSTACGKENVQESMDTSFSDIDRLEAELGKVRGTGKSELGKDINGILYAMECFKNVTDAELDNCVFQCEVEYLIAGKDNDYDNLTCVVNQIILHRLPVNMAVLLSDAEKMAEISSMAATLALVPGITYGAAKYLLAACFSYGETILEIQTLLAGGKIPLIKKAADWKLDLAHIGNLTSVEPASGQTEKGLDYEAFLMLLLAEKNNRMYYRMCDLIQLNTALVQDGFLITNCVDAFTIDIDITKGKRSYATSVSAVY